MTSGRELSAAAQGRGHGDEDRETDELAIYALILSIAWLFGLGSVAGIYLGRRSLRAIRDSDGALGGRAFALAAIVIGILGFLSLGVVAAIAIDANR